MSRDSFLYKVSDFQLFNKGLQSCVFVFVLLNVLIVLALSYVQYWQARLVFACCPLNIVCLGVVYNPKLKSSLHTELVFFLSILMTNTPLILCINVTISALPSFPLFSQFCFSPSLYTVFIFAAVEVPAWLYWWSSQWLWLAALGRALQTGDTRFPNHHCVVQQIQTSCRKQVWIRPWQIVKVPLLYYFKDT